MRIEYDVQHLLKALLCIKFSDILDEEYTPSYAGSSTKMDFLIKDKKIVVETKMTRENLDDKKLGSELIEDVTHYKSHSDCKFLFCLVYDPNSRIRNLHGIQNDLELEGNSNFRIRIIFAPSHN